MFSRDGVTEIRVRNGLDVAHVSATHLGHAGCHGNRASLIGHTGDAQEGADRREK